MTSQTAGSSIFERLDQLNEFERQPVTAEKLHGGSYFAGVFAGEHVAATEFVIGALFVSFGAGAYDVIVGLLLGNLLAVLSWALVCAPIAVQTRLTLYWYLRKIAGPAVTFVYNVLNAVLYCVLAMITVAASAVRIPLGIAPQTRWYPDDWRFVLVVLGVGAVVVTIAILGFKKLAQFSTVCSPWMVVMFLVGGLVTLPSLGPTNSLKNLWYIAEYQIWTGPSPPSPPKPPPDFSARTRAPAGEAPGADSTSPLPPAVQGQGARAAQAPLGFWHVVAFAWICNLAMHLGLSDMALFRYARRSWYGLYSAFGMYLGHYLSWICAGIMGAAAATAMRRPLTEIDSGSIASDALGIVGALAVVIAGWTTANPTLYRAGLALQVVTPNWPRWLVTLAVGAVTTIIACFPFVFTKLLDFVGIYGLLLMPVGAIVVVEHWIFPRIGLTQFWAARKRMVLNWPALAAWVVSLGCAVWAWQSGTMHLFFLAAPVWVLTAVLYVVLAGAAGAGRTPAESPQETAEAAAVAVAEPTAAPPVRPARSALYWLTGSLAVACLLLSLIFAVCVFLGYLPRKPFEGHLAYLTVVYFITGVAWMQQRP